MATILIVKNKIKCGINANDVEYNTKLKVSQFTTAECLCTCQYNDSTKHH